MEKETDELETDQVDHFEKPIRERILEGKEALDVPSSSSEWQPGEERAVSPCEVKITWTCQKCGVRSKIGLYDSKCPKCGEKIN